MLEVDEIEKKTNHFESALEVRKKVSFSLSEKNLFSSCQNYVNKVVKNEIEFKLKKYEFEHKENSKLFK